MTKKTLTELCAEIEIAWNERCDPDEVDRLAAETPELAVELYEFFAVLVEKEIEAESLDSNNELKSKVSGWVEFTGLPNWAKEQL